MSDDSDADVAIEFIKADCDKNGIGSVQVSDGNIFMFSSEFLERMLVLANDAEDKKVVIFVKHSEPSSTPEQAKA